MKTSYRHWFVLASVIASVIFVSCENDLETVRSFEDPTKVPDATAENSEILYYDSAKLLVKISSKELQRFALNKDPYIEFPKGIHVEFYDSLKNVNAEVKAQYAIFKEKEKLWEARKDVIVISRDGKQLNTEQLFWDQDKKIIYSHKFCRITTPNASLTGSEFVANEDFSNYTLSNPQGPLQIKNE